MGLVNFIFTVVTLFYVDKLGRRFLLISGTLIASISLYLVSLLSSNSLLVNKFWILGGLSFYVMGYCISLGSLFWVLISEIYPLSVRGFAMSIATVFQWGANFVVSLLFLPIYQFSGQTVTFAMFATFCLLACWFIYYFVPETTSVSLEKLEDNLSSGKKIRDIGQPVSKNIKIAKFNLIMD